MKFKLVLLLALLTTLPIYAHRVLLMVEDNGDGTIYIEGGLSTGGAVSGAKVVLVEKSTGRPLWQGVLGEDGSINAPQPKTAYLVKLLQSKGHAVTQVGPLSVLIEEVEELVEKDFGLDEKASSENVSKSVEVETKIDSTKKTMKEETKEEINEKEKKEHE